MNADQQKQQSALRQINKKGKTIIYTNIAAGTYNTATSTATPTSSTPHPIKAIVSDTSTPDLTSGTLVKRNDKQFLIAALALTVAPEPNDTIMLDGYSHAVISANPIYSGELPVLYTVKAKRA